MCAQIENEYGNIDESYGEAGKKYMNWIADMAVATNANVPWIMCQQNDAPQSIVSDLTDNSSISTCSYLLPSS